VSLHQAAEKVIGPSLQDIAAIYKSKMQIWLLFLKEGRAYCRSKSVRGHENKLCDQKAMSDEELKALEAYVYSHVK
jgi:cytochrome c